MEWRLTIEIHRTRGGNRIIVADFHDKYEKNQFINRLKERFKKTTIQITIGLFQNCAYRDSRRLYVPTYTKLALEAKNGGYDINKAIYILYPESAAKYKCLIKKMKNNHEK